MWTLFSPILSDITFLNSNFNEGGWGDFQSKSTQKYESYDIRLYGSS